MHFEIDRASILGEDYFKLLLGALDPSIRHEVINIDYLNLAAIYLNINGVKRYCASLRAAVEQSTLPMPAYLVDLPDQLSQMRAAVVTIQPKVISIDADQDYNRIKDYFQVFDRLCGDCVRLQSLQRSFQTKPLAQAS